MTTTMNRARHRSPVEHLVQPPRWRALVMRQGAGSILLAVVAFVAATRISPAFWAPHYLLFDSGQFVELGLLGLTMTLLITMGDIDLSVGSAVGLCACTLADLTSHGAPVVVGALVALVVGALLGLLNGLLVTILRLPSLVVTLGTLAAFRGICELLLGPDTVSMPAGFVGFDQDGFTGGRYDLPVELVAFLGVAALFGLLLHRAVFGQLVTTIGANQSAARYSGIRVDRIRLIGFVLSGLMAGVVAVLYASRVGAVQYEDGTGFELLAITIVVLGGTDIFGGRGSMLATVSALFAVAALREAMSLQSISGAAQNAVIGILLIASVLTPGIARAMRNSVAVRRHRTPQPSGNQPTAPPLPPEGAP
jgi:rhamnose transport system permease protein